MHILTNEWMLEKKMTACYFHIHFLCRLPCPTQLCGVLQIKMNVSWHRPSQQSSAFMYITSRMSSDGDKKGASSLSPSTTITTVSSSESNIEGATHDLCHLPTYQRDLLLSKFKALSRRNWKDPRAGVSASGNVRITTSLCFLSFHRTQFIISLLHEQEVGIASAYSDTQCWYVRRPTSSSLIWFFWNLLTYSDNFVFICLLLFFFFNR